MIRASEDVATLLPFTRQPHWAAESGTHGEGDLRHGKRGADLLIEVPLGTLVIDDRGTLLADLVTHGRGIVVANGGKGGRGNASFVSPKRRAPAFAEQGEFGEEAWINLELKLVADAALIGFPNAGKSTLISRVSAAKPKIADYPFTTLTPNLGVVSFDDREFVLADVPGLIEGAADGKGLGHEFLRHVERARVLVILLDPTQLQDRSYTDQLDVLERELAQHSEELARRPRIIALGKIDAIADTVEHREWAGRRQIELLFVSSVAGDGLDALMHAIADQVDRTVREAPQREGYVLHRPLGEGFVVNREDEAWVVTGRIAERAVNLNDLTLPEAAALVATRLTRIGVDDALSAAGAVAGDDVRIGGLTFTFDPEAEDVEP